MKKFTSRRKKGIIGLLCLSLCTAYLGNLPMTALSVQASGMEYLSNGDPTGQDAVAEVRKQQEDQPENAYYPLLDQTGEYELKTYDEKDLFVTLTGALNGVLDGSCLSQYYAIKLGKDPNFFKLKDGTDCYKQLVELTAGAEYAVVTEEVKTCLKQLAVLITGDAEKWPELCYFSQYRITRECTEVCSVSGSAVVDVTTQPLYVDLSQTLSYACHGSSLKSCYDSMKESHPEYFGTEEEDYYLQLAKFAGESGLCPVTEEIKGCLQSLAKTFLQDETGDLWWQFCFYYQEQLTEREELTYETIFLYGNPSLEDQDALVILITGNGFGSSDMVKYIAEASTLFHSLVDDTVYGENWKAIKVYFLNSYGNESKEKLKCFLKDKDTVDYSIVLDNSMDYRESREGTIFTCTMNNESRELLLQDLSRALTGWNGSGFADSGIETTQSWYHTGEQCKMQNAQAADFCEFCKEEIRRGISVYSNEVLLYYQPKGKIFLEGCEPEDLLSSIYVRKNGIKMTADQIPDQFYLTYYDQNGSVSGTIQTEKSGTYKLRIVFLGNGLCDPVMVDTTYHVDVTFHYDTQGGSTVSDTYETVGEKIGASLPLPTREGYTFKGWYTAAEGGQKVNEDTYVTESMTLYAHWLKNYDVTFNGNGSGVSLSESLMTVVSGEKIGTLPKASRKGYVFKGWYTAKTGGKKITASTAITKKTTFFARWSKVTVPQVSSVKLTGNRKSIRASYKRISGAAGYEIKYSIYKAMSKPKTVTVSGTVRTLNNLTSSRIYYVKVRAYKLDSLGKKVYGAWSVRKACKAK